MTTTEAALGQPLDGSPSVQLEAPPSVWLPLTAGDTADALEARTPEHAWPASLFIFFTTLTAIGLGVGAVGCAAGLVYTLVTGEPQMAMLAGLGLVGCTVGCGVQRSLANHLEHFSRWGWWGAMAELALGAVANAQVFLTTHSGGLVSLVANLLWMLYFWRRRADFDIDIGA